MAPRNPTPQRPGGEPRTPSSRGCNKAHQHPHRGGVTTPAPTVSVETVWESSLLYLPVIKRHHTHSPLGWCQRKPPQPCNQWKPSGELELPPLFSNNKEPPFFLAPGVNYGQTELLLLPGNIRKPLPLLLQCEHQTKGLNKI